jgi:hypothetical protein
MHDAGHVLFNMRHKNGLRWSEVPSWVSFALYTAVWPVCLNQRRCMSSCLAQLGAWVYGRGCSADMVTVALHCTLVETFGFEALTTCSCAFCFPQAFSRTMLHAAFATMLPHQRKDACV